MININTFNKKDGLPEVDVFLNVLVAQLCVDIDQESHPEREHQSEKEAHSNEKNKKNG